MTCDFKLAELQLLRSAWGMTWNAALEAVESWSVTGASALLRHMPSGPPRPPTVQQLQGHRKVRGADFQIYRHHVYRGLNHQLLFLETHVPTPEMQLARAVHDFRNLDGEDPRLPTAIG
ncbi:hypothetical protein [Streptomyces sp. NPDC048438]|uniref:hypothetical protein n=1 Tax=Streptomyces sp. NPDC048438 TaxID=3365551 RepID=UPI00371B1684